MRRRFTTAALLAGLLAGPALAAAQGPGGVRVARAGAARPTAQEKSAPAAADAWRRKHGLYFERNWGVDVVGVHPVSSGLMLRFDYRVVDPVRAAPLSDRTVRPYLIDEASRTALAVPAMENVGELRQVAPPQPNRTYYMIFGNPGRLVKRGSRVTLMVGNLKAEGLVVN